MVRLVPESPEFVTESEREVWDLLRRKGNPEWTLLSNVNLTGRDRDYEADLVVLMPDVGVVVLEVKGGNVWIDSATGHWKQGSGPQARTINPVEQAKTVKHAIWQYVKDDRRWGSRSRVRFGHSVVFPRQHLDADFSTADCPRAIAHGRGDLADLAGRLWDIAAQQESGFRVPTLDDCDLIVEILAGRSLPQRDLLADAEERERLADRLTLEQATLLKVTRLLHRTEVRGGAGSGKTVLALTQAKELTHGRGEQKAKRVALLCYSIGLATWFKRALAGVDRKSHPAFVGTFEEFAGFLGVETFGSRDDADFWEQGLPEQMADLVTDLPHGKKFDAFIVDESQDFADLWWTPIMRALRDEERGGLHLYSDENQRVFARFGRPPVPLVPLLLDHNLRNTKQIAETFSSLTPTRMIARGGDGPEVDMVRLPDGVEPTDVIEAADDAVDRLLDEGWRPEDVMLLTTGSRHPEQVSQQEMLGQGGYWESFYDADQVFYGHVLGCKGLERRAVVLAVNDKAMHHRAKERLYVGLSRATDKLVVVGVPDLIRQMGGAEVAKRLAL